MNKLERVVNRNPALILLLGFPAILLLSGLLAFAGAHFEAQAYRKHCDTPVTTWDALWLDLRIDEC